MVLMTCTQYHTAPIIGTIDFSKGISNWNRGHRNIPSPRAADPKKLCTKKREGAARSAAEKIRTKKRDGAARSADGVRTEK